MIGNESQPTRILLDTGEKDNQEYLGLLKGYLSENNLRISSVVVSHWHPDHIGGVPNLVKGLSLEGKRNSELCKKTFSSCLKLFSGPKSSQTLNRCEDFQTKARKRH